MKIVSYGVIFETQAHGGISNIYNEIYPLMCNMDDSLMINILTQRKLMRPVPVHPRVLHNSTMFVENIMRPNRIFGDYIYTVKNKLFNYYIGSGHNSIWHPTYYHLPGKWSGKIVITVLDMIHELYPNFYNFKGVGTFIGRKERCIKQADALIAISNTTAEDICRIYDIPRDKIHVAHLSCAKEYKKVDDSGIKPHETGDKPYLLYVGGRNYHKNFAAFIGAYSHWNKREEFNIVVVGSPFSPEEIKILHQWGIADAIINIVNPSNEQLCSLYNHAEVFIYPSLYEGFGIPLLEAMACGCPLVAADIKVVNEVAADVPYYFDPEDNNSILSAIDKALANGKNHPKIQKGIDHAGRYSWNNTAKEVLKVYKCMQ